MKKSYRIEVDCANCAAKIERAIQQIEGVEEASVGFMTQKMVICAQDERFDEVMEEVVRVAKKVKPDFEILG